MVHKHTHTHVYTNVCIGCSHFVSHYHICRIRIKRRQQQRETLGQAPNQRDEDVSDETCREGEGKEEEDLAHVGLQLRRSESNFKGNKRSGANQSSSMGTAKKKKRKKDEDGGKKSPGTAVAFISIYTFFYFNI